MEPDAPLVRPTHMDPMARMIAAEILLASLAMGVIVFFLKD
jgi:hypothetical protein